MRRFLAKVRFIHNLVWAFWKDQRRLIVAGFIFGTLAFFVLPRINNQIFRVKTTKIGLVGKYTIDQLPLKIRSLIGEGLTCVRQDGWVSPCLASSWEVGGDGREYIFTIKSGARWQDGKPVLASEINYNFNDVAISLIDVDKIKFTLKEPFSPFPVVVSQPLFKKGMIGTGKYQIRAIKKNGDIVEKLELSGGLIYRFYPTESAARTAFRLGEANVLKNLGDVGELQNWPNIQITPNILNERYVAILFNLQNSNLENKTIRQALAYAINLRWEPRAINPINPQSWAFNRSVKLYDYNLDKARQMLDKAIKEENLKMEKIELSTIPSLISVAEAIKSDWEKLGIKVNIKVMQTLEEGFEALLISEEVPPDPDQYHYWHSTQPTNVARLKSPKIDKLLEDGRKTIDIEKRKNIYADFQKSIVEELPAIFLFHPTVFTVSRKQN